MAVGYDLQKVRYSVIEGAMGQIIRANGCRQRGDVYGRTG